MEFAHRLYEIGFVIRTRTTWPILSKHWKLIQIA